MLNSMQILAFAPWQDVRFRPQADDERFEQCPLYPRKQTFAVHQPMSALGHKRTSPHSITSSARTSTAGGIARPSALAALRLITNSFLVGACTGRSAGFSPLRMRST